MSCCFSGFKQLFAEGQEFTYDLADMGRYYCDYVELMDHWDAVLPGKVLRVEYENVVNDTENEVRRLLEFCELPFERLEELSSNVPSLQHQMFRLLSKEIGQEAEMMALLGRSTAEERVASFLLIL